VSRSNSEKEFKNSNNLFITSSETLSSPQGVTSATMPSDAEWGIDTVYLSMSVKDQVPELANNSWQVIGGTQTEKVDKTKFTSFFDFGYANVNVSYFPLYEAMYLHFNAARLLSRKSSELLPPRALRPLVETLLIELIPQIPVLPVFVTIDGLGTIDFEKSWAEQVKVTRLDCARNFYVDCPEYVRHALSHVKGKYEKTVHIYHDHEGWTRANATKSAGIDRIYDKSAELRNLELDERFFWDKRVYRFETQLQKDRLKKFGTKTLDRITDETVWQILETRWKSCGWGISLPGAGSLDELLTSLELKDRLSFSGFLALCGEGMGDLIDDKSKRKFHRIASKIGLVPGLSISSYRPMTRILSLWYGSAVNATGGFKGE